MFDVKEHYEIVEHASIEVPKPKNKEELKELHLKLEDQSMLFWSSLFVSFATGMGIFLGDSDYMDIATLCTSVVPAGLLVYATGNRISAHQTKKKIKELPQQKSLAITSGEKANSDSSGNFKEGYDYPYVEWDNVFIKYLPMVVTSEEDYAENYMKRGTSHRPYRIFAKETLGKDKAIQNTMDTPSTFFRDNLSCLYAELKRPGGDFSGTSDNALKIKKHYS